MPAYARLTLAQFVGTDPDALVGKFESGHARDGYATQFAQQTIAWSETIPLLQRELLSLQRDRPGSSDWQVLFEYPLYRLRKRIDVVILTRAEVIVLEVKSGERTFRAQDERQVEEYALDLRDFHAASQSRPLLPILWCTHAIAAPQVSPACTDQVAPVQRVGNKGLATLLAQIPERAGQPPIDACAWDASPYRPVPNVIEAATSIFAGHDVRSIAQADASNLRDAAARIIQILVEVQRVGRRALIFLTGVPGSGKTLAGLHVVHDAIATGAERAGDIVYLSGNTPLVTVLREALARDEYGRNRTADVRKGLKDIRRDVRTRIQHINDFLKQGLSTGQEEPPHEHVIVFDEAQRAWDAKQGERKFDRKASEPALLIELMSRHRGWCGCVCLVGGGQEINSGEQGIASWGEALRQLSPTAAAEWSVHAPTDVLVGGPSTNGQSIGNLPTALSVKSHPDLQLQVPLRSFRSPAMSDWVRSVLRGEAERAASIAGSQTKYPVMLTRSLDAARSWLQAQGRGHRRYGLVASSGARRLRADGLGVLLSPMDSAEIAHWYLNPIGDIRSSFSLEVPANQYACQGLELDFVGLCWGGDFMRDNGNTRWTFRALKGKSWNTVDQPATRQFIENSYRVLMTRAREGMVLWIPNGDPKDATRDLKLLDATAAFLQSCGARAL